MTVYTEIDVVKNNRTVLNITAYTESDVVKKSKTDFIIVPIPVFCMPFQHFVSGVRYTCANFCMTPS